MSSAQSAKVALWAMYSSLIEAFTANQVPDQLDFVLPVWAPQQYSELEGVQYLSLLAAYLWHGKIWSPVTRQMMTEVLHYYRHEIYQWHSNTNWPIAARLATLSSFVQMLELASAYQLTSASARCQDGLQSALAQMRVDLNQWALGTLAEDMDARIALTNKFIRSVCR